MMRGYPFYPQRAGQLPSSFSDQGSLRHTFLQAGRGPNHDGHGMMSNQHGFQIIPSTLLLQHEVQEDPSPGRESRSPGKNSAIDDRPCRHMGSRHRLLQTAPPPDGVAWTRQAAIAHGIDPEVMRIIIWNMSADEFEDILAHYRSGRADRATHRILAVYMRYHKKVPSAQEFSMVTKANVPFEEFALNTSPSGLFWADWQNSHALNEWKLVALAIFIELGEEQAAHRIDESKPDSKLATHSDEEDDGELSDDTLADSSHPVAPQRQAPCDSTSDPKCPTMATASGHSSSRELVGRDEKKISVYAGYENNCSGHLSLPSLFQDDWGLSHDDDDFFELRGVKAGVSLSERARGSHPERSLCSDFFSDNHLGEIGRW